MLLKICFLIEEVLLKWFKICPMLSNDSVTLTTFETYIVYMVYRPSGSFLILTIKTWQNGIHLIFHNSSPLQGHYLTDGLSVTAHQAHTTRP